MKQEYIESLKELFSLESFDEATYLTIVEKYDSWYEKLLSEGKNDEEIRSILKSPEEVVEVFRNKYNESIKAVETKENIVIEEKVKAEENIEVDKTQENNESKKALPDGIIERKTFSGKVVYLRKRYFGERVSLFLLFLFVSFFVLPILMSFFTASLTISFTSMVLFFTPIYYLVFVMKNGDINYLQPDQWGVFTDKSGEITSVPADIANNVIAQLNGMTTFSFETFLHTTIISLFAFAILLIGLYATLQFFKSIVAYFVWFFDKISFKKVKI